MCPSLTTKGSRWKGLWFGQLEDGTECSVVDLHCFDIPVIQVVRVRFTGQTNNIIDEGKVRVAANYVRRRFPELNREEHPCLYSESRFCRRIVPENEAEQATVVRVHDLQSVRIDSQEQGDNSNDAEIVIHRFIKENLLPKHPGSFSRLGWRVDVFYKTIPTTETETELVPEENEYHNGTMLAWYVFSMSHSIADGTAMHVVVDDYLQTYMKILNQSSEPAQIDLLEPRRQLPLISSMPRKNLPLTWYHYFWTSILGLLVGYILQFVQPQPKLVPNIAEDRKAGEDHHNHPYTRSNNYSLSCVELDPPTTNALCQSARSINITVGSMVHAALFVSLAKRYFDEHQTSNSLSLPIPLPVNMRKFMIPELPSTVLAPQQGILQVNFCITKWRLQKAISNESMMIELLKELAESSQKQVQRVLRQQNNCDDNSTGRFGPLDGPLMAASMYRCHLSKFLRIKYVSYLQVKMTMDTKPLSSECVTIISSSNEMFAYLLLFLSL